MSLYNRGVEEREGVGGEGQHLHTPAIVLVCRYHHLFPLPADGAHSDGHNSDGAEVEAKWRRR